MADHSHSSTLLFNNQWIVVSMSTNKTRLPYPSKPMNNSSNNNNSPSTNIEVSSSLNVTSANTMEITHNVILNGWLVQTITVLKGVASVSSKSLPSKQQLYDSISEEDQEKEQEQQHTNNLTPEIEKDPSLLLLNIFKQMEENTSNKSENKPKVSSPTLDSQPLKTKSQKNSSIRRKVSSTTDFSSCDEAANALQDISSPIAPETPATTVVSAPTSEPTPVKFIRKQKQHSLTYASSSTATSPFKRNNSSTDDDEEEEEDDSSSLPLIKRGISKMPKHKQIVSTPNLTSISQPQKRDRKNIVKNFIKAFRGFLSNNTDEQEAIEVLASTLGGSRADAELSRVRISFEKFIENKNFNNTLMVQLISNTDFTLLLHHFLTQKAPEWIAQSKIKDKLSHEEALHHYLLSLKDTSALLKVRCLKYRTNSTSLSTSVLPDLIDSTASAAAN